MSNQSDLSALFPGKDVPLTPDFSIRVFPVGFAQLPRFVEVVAGWVASAEHFLPQLFEGKAPESVDWPKLVQVLVPLVVRDALDLVDECCEPRMSQIPRLPIGKTAEVVKEWLLQSMDEKEVIRPLLELVEAPLERITGEKLGLWDMAKQSLFSRPTASPSTTSSDGSTPASPTPG